MSRTQCCRGIVTRSAARMPPCCCSLPQSEREHPHSTGQGCKKERQALSTIGTGRSAGRWFSNKEDEAEDAAEDASSELGRAASQAKDKLASAGQYVQDRCARDVPACRSCLELYRKVTGAVLLVRWMHAALPHAAVQSTFARQVCDPAVRKAGLHCCRPCLSALLGASYLPPDKGSN